MPSLNTGNAILSNAIAVDSSYNVGIGGAADASYKLKVTGASNITGTVTLATSSGVLAINTTGRPAGVGGGDNGKVWSKQATSGNYGIATIASATDSFTYIGHNGTDALLGTSYGTTGAYTDLVIQTADVTRFRLSGSTGAATFSSSVTATSGIFSVGTSSSIGFAITQNSTFAFGSTNGRRISEIRYNTGDAPGLQFGYDATDNTGIIAGATQATGAGLDFYTFNGSAWGNRMRITSGGNVAIGLTNDTYRLTVANNGGSSYIGSSNQAGGTGDRFIRMGFGTGATFAQIQGTRLNVADDVPIALQPGGGTVFIGRSSVFSTFGDSNGIVQYGEGTIYCAASNNESLGLSRIGTDGFVAIFRRSTTTVGSISVNGSATAFNTSSDYRLKEDLKQYNGLDLVSKIKTYDFAWKNDKSRNYGVIAHEVADVIPYVVIGEKDAINEDGTILPQGVDYSKLVPILVKAIQELNQKVNDQQQTINSLINR
jgi:hypothetical protein